MTSNQPAISVENHEAALSMLLMKNSPYKNMRRSIEMLAEQTIADQIEVIFHVDPLVGFDDMDLSILDRLAGYKVVFKDYPNINNFNELVRFCSGEAVGFYEDHVFPSPDWAEAQLEAIRSGFVGTCSRVVPSNPDQFWGWVSFYPAYGFFTDPPKYQDAEDVILHNGIYYKEALLAFGPLLKDLYKRNGRLNQILREQGGRLCITEKGMIAHINPSAFTATFILLFNSGRIFAALKTQRKKLSRLMRIVNAVLCPVVPFQRLAERIPVMFSGGRNSKNRLKIILALLVGFMMDALGRVVGFLVGPGDAEKILTEFEDNRLIHLVKKEFEFYSQ